MRVNLDNTIPVRGVEMRMHVTDSTINRMDLTCCPARAEHMAIFVVSRNNEIRVIALQFKQCSNRSGEGLIFRIPQLTSEEKVDLVASRFSDSWKYCRNSTGNRYRYSSSNSLPG